MLIHNEKRLCLVDSDGCQGQAEPVEVLLALYARENKLEQVVEESGQVDSPLRIAWEYSENECAKLIASWLAAQKESIE